MVCGRGFSRCDRLACLYASVVHLKLICPSGPAGIYSSPENEGFDRERALALLHAAEAQGDSYEVVFSDDLSDSERERLYIYEAIPAAGNRMRIRRVFGSNRAGGGPCFGKEVPALLVSEGARGVAVYPNETQRQVQTIMHYLESRATAAPAITTP